MIATSRFANTAARSLLAAAALFFSAGCARLYIPPQAETKEPPPIAAPAAQALRAPPSGIAVSDELAADCQLDFNDDMKAPTFDFDDSAVALGDAAVLAQVAACLTTGPLAGRALGLVGHADPRGESEYNMALEERRASSVSVYLSKLGVDRAKIVETSRGKLDASGTDEGGWKRDRRVDVLLH